MSFLSRVAGLSLGVSVRPPGKLGVEPQLLRTEKSKLRWFGHLDRWTDGNHVSSNCMLDTYMSTIRIMSGGVVESAVAIALT